jgi:hypothetical protein
MTWWMSEKVERYSTQDESQSVLRAARCNSSEFALSGRTVFYTHQNSSVDLSSVEMQLPSQLAYTSTGQKSAHKRSPCTVDQ